MGQEEMENIHTANEGAVQGCLSKATWHNHGKVNVILFCNSCFHTIRKKIQHYPLHHPGVGWTRVVGWLGAAAAFPLIIFLMIE